MRVLGIQMTAKSTGGQSFTFTGDGRSKQVMGACLRDYTTGTTIFEPCGSGSSFLFIEAGWVVLSKSLPSGARVVTDFALRGDILSTATMRLAQETARAASPTTLYEFREHLSGGGLDLSPQLSKTFVLEMMKRHARLTERMANIGGREALERTVHLFFELSIRANSGARAEIDRFECPLRQSDLGEAVGVSTVHMNRILKDLRERGLLSFRNGTVEFLNRNKLLALVEFDSSYLHADL